MCVAVAKLLGFDQNFLGHIGERAIVAQCVFELDELLDLIKKEVVVLAELVDALDAPAHLEGVAHVVEAALAGDAEFAAEFLGVDGPLDGLAVGSAKAGVGRGASCCTCLGCAVGASHDVEHELRGLDSTHREEPLVVAIEAQAEPLDFHAADDLLQRFFEGPADRHRFAHALHLRGERFVGLGELLKRPARHLHDAVVDGGFEAGAGGACDVVLEFVERVADGEAGGDLRNRKARCLASECAGTRHAWVHLDDDHLEGLGAVGVGLGVGVHGELHVAAACFDAHGPHDGDGGVAHRLIFLVGQSEDRRDGDAVARVHAHGVDVLDAADDDAVVFLIADDFELELFPADHALVYLHLGDHAGGESARNDVAEFFEVVSDAAARTAQRKGGPNDGGQADLLQELFSIGQRVDGLGLGKLETDLLADVLEDLAVFGAVDDLAIRADHLDAELFERAVIPEAACAVEGGLSAQRG